MSTTAVSCFSTAVEYEYNDRQQVVHTPLYDAVCSRYSYDVKRSTAVAGTRTDFLSRKLTRRSRTAVQG